MLDSRAVQTSQFKRPSFVLHLDVERGQSARDAAYAFSYFWLFGLHSIQPCVRTCGLPETSVADVCAAEAVAAEDQL